MASLLMIIPLWSPPATWTLSLISSTSFRSMRITVEFAVLPFGVITTCSALAGADDSSVAPFRCSSLCWWLATDSFLWFAGFGGGGGGGSFGVDILCLSLTRAFSPKIALCRNGKGKKNYLLCLHWQPTVMELRKFPSHANSLFSIHFSCIQTWIWVRYKKLPVIFSIG